VDVTIGPGSTNPCRRCRSLFGSSRVGTTAAAFSAKNGASGLLLSPSAPRRRTRHSVRPPAGVSVRVGEERLDFLRAELVVRSAMILLRSTKGGFRTAATSAAHAVVLRVGRSCLLPDLRESGNTRWGGALGARVGDESFQVPAEAVDHLVLPGELVSISCASSVPWREPRTGLVVWPNCIITSRLASARRGLSSAPGSDRCGC